MESDLSDEQQQLNKANGTRYIRNTTSGIPDIILETRFQNLDDNNFNLN